MSAPPYEVILESKDEIIKNLLKENEKLKIQAKATPTHATYLSAPKYRSSGNKTVTL